MAVEGVYVGVFGGGGVEWEVYVELWGALCEFCPSPRSVIGLELHTDFWTGQLA